MTAHGHGKRVLAGTAAALLFLLSTAAIARAQTPDFGFRAFGHYEMVSMTASNTFDAVLGTSSLMGPGGGGEVTGIWKGLFVRGGFSQMKDSGSRAFVFNGDVIPLNIPLTVKIRTIELGGGWRFVLPKAPRFAVYGGGGGLFINYDESSAFAGTGENVSESFNGYMAFGGVEVALWKWIFVGAEGQYRAVPDAIGAAGISDVFNESDLGGTVVRVLFGVRK